MKTQVLLTLRVVSVGVGAIPKKIFILLVQSVVIQTIRPGSRRRHETVGKSLEMARTLAIPKLQ